VLLRHSDINKASKDRSFFNRQDNVLLKQVSITMDRTFNLDAQVKFDFPFSLFEMFFFTEVSTTLESGGTEKVNEDASIQLPM
jgi:hypothetical protein